MTARFNPKVFGRDSVSLKGRALGQASCHFERGYREFVRGILVLGDAGLEPSEALAELIEDMGDAAGAAIALADDIGASLAGGDR